MRMAERAWREVDTTTIRNCWKKAGILPTWTPLNSQSPPSVPVSTLLNTTQLSDDTVESNPEKEIEAGLNALEARGVLQRTNRMSLDLLLNPEDENIVLEGGSDEDICQFVMEVIEAGEDLDTNRGDDGPGAALQSI